MPPLLSSRPPGIQILLGNVIPFVFGVVCVIVLGYSKGAYLLLQLPAIAGGYIAGLEHRTPGEGAQRGLVGGAMFAMGMLFAHAAAGTDLQDAFPHPPLLIIFLTSGFGAALGALGGRTRARRQREAATAS